MLLDTYYIGVKYQIEDDVLRKQTAKLKKLTKDLTKDLNKQAVIGSAGGSAGLGASVAAGDGKGGKTRAGVLPDVGGLKSIMGAAAAYQGVKKVVNDARSLQEAMIGVQKTTGLADEAIDRMRKNLLDAGSTDVAIDVERLAEYAEAVGTMGFDTEESILSAAIAMGKLEKASDLAGAKAAQTLGKLLGSTGSGNDEFEDLASIIVRLGNNMRTTEAQIAHTAGYLGGVSSEFKLTKEEAIALSATMADVGVTAENSSSTTQRVFTQLQSAIQSGGDDMKLLENITKMTSGEIEKLWDTDKLELYGQFAQGIGRYAEESNNTVAALLKDLSMGSVQVQSTIGSLGGGYDRLKLAVGHVRDEVKLYGTEQAAINKENEAANNSINAQLKLLGTNIRSLGDAAANNGLLGWIQSTIKGVNGMITAFSEARKAAAFKMEVQTSSAYEKAKDEYLKASRANTFKYIAKGAFSKDAAEADVREYIKERSAVIGRFNKAHANSPEGKAQAAATKEVTVNQTFNGPMDPTKAGDAAKKGVTKALATKTGGS